jgi:hypothetical protein
MVDGHDGFLLARGRVAAVPARHKFSVSAAIISAAIISAAIISAAIISAAIISAAIISAAAISMFRFFVRAIGATQAFPEWQVRFSKLLVYVFHDYCGHCFFSCVKLSVRAGV